jgi:ferric iron reductase protein FhuF
VTDALLGFVDTLDALPDSISLLLPRPGDAELTASVTLDPDWLAEQIRLRGEIWNIDDQRTLATLWWYSASNWLVMPSVLTLASTGRCLSPSLEHTVLHHRPDSRFSGAHSTEAMPSDDLEEYSRALRQTLATVIEQLALYVPRARPLWAIASDSIADRFLWAGQRLRQPEVTASLASRVIAAIGEPAPLPRFVESMPRSTQLRRSSCCLLYRVPGQHACSNCPRKRA